MLLKVKHAYLQDIVTLSITEVPYTNFSAHIPAIKWARCKLQTAKLK